MIIGVSWKKWSLLPIFDNDNKQWVVKPSLHKFKVQKKKKKEPSLHTQGTRMDTCSGWACILVMKLLLSACICTLHAIKYMENSTKKNKKRIHGEEKN